MKRQRFNTEMLLDPGWWHWTATIPLLVLTVAGYSWACWIAIGLCALVGACYLLRIKQMRPYPVQIRLAYVGVLLCGTLPGMNWFYWVPLVGTTAMVVVGYCPLLRLLSLAPWNRSGPLSASNVWHVFVRVPCVGGLVKWSSNSSLSVSMCCSLRENLPSAIEQGQVGGSP